MVSFFQRHVGEQMRIEVLLWPGPGRGTDCEDADWRVHLAASYFAQIAALDQPPNFWLPPLTFVVFSRLSASPPFFWFFRPPAAPPPRLFQRARFSFQSE